MYNYEELKPTIFTDEGQRKFLKIRDHVKNLLVTAGAVRMTEILRAGSGDTWERMACVDRMVELGELREVTNHLVPGQHRVFVGVD